MENKSTFFASRWLLVNRRQEEIQFRGESTQVEISVEIDDEINEVLHCRIHGLTYKGEDFDRFLPGFDTYALLAEVKGYLMVFPKIALVDRAGKNGESYFISTASNEKTHYMVWKIGTDDE